MFSKGDIDTIYTQAMASWTGVTRELTRLEIVRDVPVHKRAQHRRDREKFHEMVLFGIVQGEELVLETYQIGRHRMAYDISTDVLMIVESQVDRTPGVQKEREQC